MLKPRSPRPRFTELPLHKIVPQDHLLRKINQVVDFSFVHELVADRYTADRGRPAEDPEFMLRLCLLQYLYGDSDRMVIENARMHNGYKYFLGLAIDEDVPDDTTVSYFRARRLGEDKFRLIFEGVVRQCVEKGLVTGKKQIIDSTHIVADMAANSLTGLIRMCRRNALGTVAKQNRNTAVRLGLEEVKESKQDRFRRAEDGLAGEMEAAKKLLDGVTHELKAGKLKAAPELMKDLELLEKAVADREEGATDRLISPVDPDARAGRKTSKSWTGYKGHIVVGKRTEFSRRWRPPPATKPAAS